MSNPAQRPGESPQVARVPVGQGASWRQLADAPDLSGKAAAWAELMRAQLMELEGVEVLAVAAFRFDADSHELKPLASSPQSRVVSALLTATCDATATQARQVARGEMPGEQGPAAGAMVAASPLTVDERVMGVVALEMRPETPAAMRKAMRRLQWGAAWLRDALRAEDAAQKGTQYQAAVEALNTVVAVAERGDFASAASAAVTDLATRFDCDRVSLGLRRWTGTRVHAISHSAQFSRRMELVRKLAATMDEAVDQRAAVLWPEAAGDASYATLAVRDLSESHGAGHVYTVPLYAIDRFVGALVFERPEINPFGQRELEILEAVGTVLAPVLEEKRRNDRWWLTKGVDVLGGQLKRLLGPAYFLRKLLVAGLIALIAFFWVARADYQVSADAVVLGEVERAIVASFDGFVADAPASAGDVVSEGDLLVLMDDRDLTLERLRLVTLRQRQRIEFDRAVAARDRAEMGIRRTQIEQGDAEIRLIDEQIARTRLTAPFDGLIVSGDLSQSIGSAVSRGDALLTISPVDGYRVQLQVDERQIADIELGQPGALRVTALPQRSFPIVIDKITPVAEYDEGATTYQVDARLTGDSAPLRPGMEGAARVTVEERRLIAIWAKPMIDWFRVTLWRWSPV